jgi:N-formylmaleamate deformylase
LKKLLFIAIFAIGITNTKAQQSTAFKVTITGAGKPIILIPGYSCSGDVWNETVAHLKDRYQCHVLTLAGFAGMPSKTDTLILKTVRDEIIKYVKEKKLNQPIVIGHSLGSLMGLWLSSEAPDLFGKLICVDGMPFYSALNNPNANADSLKKDPRYNVENAIKNFEAMPDSNFIDRTTKALTWQVEDTARARQIATWQYNSNRKTLGITFIELLTTDIRKDIAKIKQPVLVLGSIYFTKEKSYELIEDQFKLLPKAIIHVANSKHFIMYDQPQWFYKEIDTFLK